MTTARFKTILTILGALLLLILVACAPPEPAAEEGAAPTQTTAPPAVPTAEETPTSRPEAQNTAADISGITWSLVHTIVGGDAVVSPPPAANVFFEIEQGTIAGSSGCNRFSGPVTLEGNRISVGALGLTKMACAEELMTLETTMVDILNSAASFTVEGPMLELQNGDGLPLALFAQAEQKTLFVGPEQVACEGEAPQQCLLVRESLLADPELFYDTIEGFDWEAGYDYELLVTVTENPQPPADASSLQYRLLEVVSKRPVQTGPALSGPTPTGPTLSGPVWHWQRYEDNGNVNNIEVSDPAAYTLEFMEDGTYAIQADCNGGSGDYTVDGTSVALEPPVMTMMACGEESLADFFLSRLGDVVTFVLADDGLLYLNLKMDAGNMVFAPAGG